MDTRKQHLIEHGLEELLGQRINGIVLGYEDINDHDRLRLDPVHALLAGKIDITGQNRARKEDRAKRFAVSTVYGVWLPHQEKLESISASGGQS